MSDAMPLVLVIEDQHPSWEMSDAVLRANGYRTALALNHREAEVYLAAHPGEVRAILSDNDTREGGGRAGAGYDWLTEHPERSAEVPVRMLYTGDLLYPEQKIKLAEQGIPSCDKTSGLRFLDMISLGLQERGEPVPAKALNRLGIRAAQILADRATEASSLGIERR